MASIFKKIGNFLKKDEVRAGLALGGAAAGFGAFDGMKYGNAIAGGLGGLNVASGLSAGGTSGALQAGLGGYGLAQGLGKVGTFQDSYKSLFGGGQQSQPVMSQTKSNMMGDKSFAQQSQDYYMNNKPTIRNYAYASQNDLNLASDLDAMKAAGMSDDELKAYLDGSPRKFQNFKPMFSNTSQAVAGGGGTGVGRTDAFVGQGGNLPVSTANVSTPNLNSAPSGPMSTPGNYMNSSGQMVVNGVVQGPSGANSISSAASSMQAAASGATNNAMTINGMPVLGFDGTGNAIVRGADGNILTTTIPNAQSQEPFSFGGLFDNIAEKAMQNPMQAVSVGSALVTAFAESPQEKAAREYADEIARVRAQTDPNSDFGQTFIDTYTQQRQDELDKAYASAKAEWVNSMAKRGMTNSTVSSEGLASLDAKFAELQSKLPSDALNALQQYQNNQFKNLNAGLAPAATQAKLMASQSNPFSMASQGAVASVGS